MHMVAPRTGAPETSVAEEQHEYRQLTCAVYRTHDGGPFEGGRYLVSRWRFTDDERARIAAGEDLYISHLTWDGPLQPLMPQVGTGGWVEVFDDKETP